MKRFLPILLGASLSLAVATSALAIERGGSMAFARYDDSAIIDPVWADRNPDLWLINALYETLLRNGPDGSIVAGLAESHDVSADGKTITLTLREGLKFSDGSPLTGKDVVFSLDRARNPDLGPWAGLLGSVESVTAEGETVFAWPGIGNYIASSLFRADINAVLGGTVLIGTVFILLNMVSDMLYQMLDPRSNLRRR